MQLLDNLTRTGAFGKSRSFALIKRNSKEDCGGSIFEKAFLSDSERWYMLESLYFAQNRKLVVFYKTAWKKKKLRGNKTTFKI